MKAKYRAEVDSLEKVEPIFATLKKLRGLIRERGIQGYKGLLIEFLEFDPKFSQCIDLAAKSKLFSIIVEDLDSAKEILKLNNEIKGGVIQIYPLSIIHQVTQEKQRNYPDRADTRPLHTLIKLKHDADNRLSTLVRNLFSKVLLVRDYPVAMEVAKQWNLTCITADLQIVHAGAFITQVGSYNRSQADRVTLYRKVSTIEKEVEEKVVQSLQFDKLRDQETERELDCLRRIQKADVSVTSLKNAYQQLSSMLFELKAQHDHKVQHTGELERTIESSLSQEKELNEVIKQLEKQANGQQGEAFSGEDSNRLLVVNRQLDEVGRRIAAKEGERVAVYGQLQQKRDLLNQSYLRKQNDIQVNMLEQEIDVKVLEKNASSQGVSRSDEETLNIEREKAQIDQHILKLQQELEEAQRDYKSLRGKAEQVSDFEEDPAFKDIMERLRAKIAQIEELSNTMLELQTKNDDLDVKIKQLESQNYDIATFEEARRNKPIQVLTREIQERAGQLEAFPHKNRHCVEWFDKYSAKHSELKKKFEDQIETEQGMLRLLQDLDEQKQQALEKNFLKLNENFCETFNRVVPQGWAELRLIKKDQGDESQISHPSQFQDGSQIIKIGQQIYKGIKVKVSFQNGGQRIDPQAGAEGLGHLSGGQKAVVAACLLFSALKIEAAPFYIMDEFDNALDGENRAAIATLIFDLSKKSQFLMTTFKPELIDGADKIYHVTTRNHVSQMHELAHAEQAHKLIQKHK
ncbi:hypothetical protein FGO68_gene5106 [Halteria grandinella]|uniref:SMC hinge domain-containing protein n=1 Tax=Halteria grandinella TaxID=5974 RepID=A0A8J8NFL5_HALGN|nr:hypothetical protein FGO68_gene5106 [Halteria grandinella]